MVRKRVVAIIPARGGSKRIKNKNIIKFQGKPLIAWTIEAAIQSDLFQRIIVSTDDEDIARIAIEWGAEVPFYREKFADDNSPVSLATVDTLKKVMNYYDEKYEDIIQLMPNCPMRTGKDIQDAYNYFTGNNIIFQISAFQFGWMNPWWAAELDKNFTPRPIFKNQELNKRSQDLSDLFCPTGAIWIARCENLIAEQSFYGSNHIFFPMDWKNAVDIDEYNDLEMAEAIYSIVRKEI